MPGKWEKPIDKEKAEKPADEFKRKYRSLLQTAPKRALYVFGFASADGGTDHISNLQLLCGHCNSVKGTRTQEELLLMLTDKGWIKRKKAA